MHRLRLSAAGLAAAFMIATLATAQERPPGGRAAPVAPAPEFAPPGFPPPPNRGVDIEEVLARVAASTGKKFLVDPRVRAQVFTVPEIGTPTYTELLSILRIHGFTAAEIGGRVNIVPDANARFLPARLVQRDDPSVPDDEYVMRVLSVKHAEVFVPVLRPLMPQSAHLAAMVAEEEGGDGKLILVDTYANIRKMTELINTLTR
jgi:general secretion pathway protein D